MTISSITKFQYYFRSAIRIYQDYLPIFLFLAIWKKENPEALMHKIVWILALFATTRIFADDQLDRTVKEFERYAEEARKTWEVPGVAIGIVKGDKVIFTKGFGQRGLQDKRPVDEGTIFQIGSLSKAFTSALVAIGADRKWLKWDDKVIAHLPDFRVLDPWVTQAFEIVDLMGQRSGLPTGAGDSQSLMGYTDAELLQHLRFLQPVSSFRSQFAYQNVFYLAAAEILKRKSGLSYQEMLKKELFDPLGMNETTTTVAEYLNEPNSAEWLMRLPNGKVEVLSRDFPGREWIDVLKPAGGINSNVRDMVKWMILQANEGRFAGKEIISKDNLKRTHQPLIFMDFPFPLTSFYALGWIHSAYDPHAIIWHNGATFGVYNVAAFIPEEKLGIIVLSNMRNTELSLALAMQFFDLYFGKKGTDWSQDFLKMMQEKEKKFKEMPPPASFFPSQPLENYAGTYRNPVFGEVRVETDGKDLKLIIGKNQTKIPLQHWSRDTFTLDWTPFQEETSKVFFYSDGDKPVTKMNAELFSREGDGVFELRPD